MAEPPDEDAPAPREPLVPNVPPSEPPASPPARARWAPKGGTAGRRTEAGQARRARGPVLLAILALLIGGGIVDRIVGSPAKPSGPAAPPVPVAADAAALSSSWLCSGATGTPSGIADGTLEIANTTARTLRGTITLVPSSGAKARMAVSIPPRTRQAFPETAAHRAAFVGAIVNLDSGAATVEQVVVGSNGVAVAPCATAGSQRWYFATGTTLRDATVYLGLLNPYPEDAIVDLSFTTEQGVEQPADFQGIVVPADSEVGVDLGDHLRRRYQIATTVSTRVGRIVAFKTQVVAPPPAGAQVVGNTPPAAGDPNDPVPPVAGLTLTLGTPSPALQWTWPDGLATAGVTERYEIYNPTAKAAHLKLHIVLDQGTADPLDITVSPHGTATVQANGESRIPKGVGHAAVLQSVNGVPVVAERTVAEFAPSARSGLGELFGGRLAARTWILAAGDASPTTAEWIEIFNPTTVTTTASIVGMDPSGTSTIERVAISGGHRAAVQISAKQQAHRTLLVRASGDVIVERDLYTVGGRGVALSLGVPLSP